MQQNEFLANDPLAALKLSPMALQGGGQGINKGDPMGDMARTLATSYITGLPMFGYSGTTKVPQNYMSGTTKVPQNYMSGTTMVPQNYMAGIDEIPGQRTAQDTVPAMLSPGEAVIPASAAQDPANQGAIEGMVQEGREDQGMAVQILQALGLPPEPQIIAMIEDMLAQGIPPEQILQQLQERMGGAQGGQEAPPQEGMGMPQGLYGGSANVQQSPLSGKGQREQQKFQADESRKDAAFQADQRRKDDAHSESMKQKSESAMYARSMSGE